MAEGDVLYVLSGEFDNKYGPSIKCQFPTSIPGFDTAEGDSEAIDAALLASLMIPNNAEHRAITEPDHNIFTLYLNNSAGKYQLLPPLGEGTKERNIENPSRINFINVVKTQRDSSNSRGARIRSIAVGSLLQNVDALKPFLSQALTYIMEASDVSEIEEVLRSCFRALNSLDISSIETSIDQNPIRQVLCSVQDRKSLTNLLTANTTLGREILKILGTESTDEKGNKIVFEKGRLRLHFDSCSIDTQFEGLTEKPIDLGLLNSTPSEYRVSELHICKFLIKFIPMLRRLPSSHYSFKLIVNSHRLPKRDICQFVVLLSQLMGCFIADGRTKYYDDTSVLILPYAEVSMIKKIREYFIKCGSFRSFSIVGTGNSIFQHHNDLWDYYYDIDNDLLLASTDQTVSNRISLWDNNPLRKFLQKSITDPSPYHITETGRIGLVTAFLGLISEENLKEEDILPILKRINILQITGHLRSTGGSVTSSFCSSYVATYKDFMKFNVFFTKGSLSAIRHLSTLDRLLSDLFDPSQVLSKRLDLISQLNDTLDEIFSFVDSSDTMLMIFLNVGLNYSPFLSLCEGKFTSEDSSNWNLRQEVAETGKKYRSWISVLDDGRGTGFFEKFLRIRVFDLLSMPFLLNTDIHKSNRLRARGYERNSADTLSVSSSGSSDSETKRPRSMSLKWIMNIPKNIDNLIEGPSLLWSDAASVSSSIGRVTLPKSSNTGSTSSASSLSSASSEQVKSKDFRQKTESAKRVTVQILSRIKSHPVGNYLITESMSPFALTMFQVSEAEFVT